MSWQRVYQRKMHGCVYFFVGGVLSFMGLIFLLFFPAIGVLLLLGAVGVPLLIRHLFTSFNIVCTPEGFTVSTESKRAGSKQEKYTWEEVTGTDYDEFRSRSTSNNGTRTTRYFSVETTRGQALRVDSQISQFDDLISVFNHMTPQLPYIWERQAGFSIRIGAVSAGREAYRKVPRPEAAPQASGEPQPQG